MRSTVVVTVLCTLVVLLFDATVSSAGSIAYSLGAGYVDESPNGLGLASLGVSKLAWRHFEVTADVAYMHFDRGTVSFKCFDGPCPQSHLKTSVIPVSIGLADPVAAARAFAPDLGTAPERHFAGPTRTIELEVPDRPLLVELLPWAPPAAVVSGAPATPRPARPAPTAARGGAPGPPVPAAAGDLDAPDAARGPATAAAAPDPTVRGPLAFTGSAALPLLAASGLLVLVGTAALAASRRRWHHHR